MKTLTRTIDITVTYDNDDITEEDMEQDMWDSVRFGLCNESECTDYDIGIVVVD